MNIFPTIVFTRDTNIYCAKSNRVSIRHELPENCARQINAFKINKKKSPFLFACHSLVNLFLLSLARVGEITMQWLFQIMN